MDDVERRRRLEAVIASTPPQLGLAVAALGRDAGPQDIRRVAAMYGVAVEQLARGWSEVHGDRISIDSVERAG